VKTKICRRCGKRRPLKVLKVDRKARGGRDALCRKCDAEDSRKRRRRAYGLSKGGFREMVVAQAGRCAICRKKCRVNRELSVDHDHETGRVRGLLCSHCNSGIGLLGDSPELVSRAYGYLTGHALTRPSPLE